MFALLAIAAAANGADLTIVSGGRRIVDPDPSSAASNCRGWSYGAMPVADASGAITTIYSSSDVLTNHCAEPLSSAGHFGDRIWRHTRGADGTWSGAAVVGRDVFPWMANPDASSAVGHLSSPAVVRLDGRWYMAFTASVSDPNLCAGEHGPATTCGSCTDPWSHFAMMWAVSDDGAHWRVRGGSGANRILRSTRRSSGASRRPPTARRHRCTRRSRASAC